MRLARLMASGVASTCGLPLEEVEDFRIAVDELCSTLIEMGDGQPIRLAFEIAPTSSSSRAARWPGRPPPTTSASPSAARSSTSSPTGTSSRTSTGTSSSRPASGCGAAGPADAADRPCPRPSLRPGDLEDLAEPGHVEEAAERRRDGAEGSTTPCCSAVSRALSRARSPAESAKVRSPASIWTRGRSLTRRRRSRRADRTMQVELARQRDDGGVVGAARRDGHRFWLSVMSLPALPMRVGSAHGRSVLVDRSTPGTTDRRVIQASNASGGP